MRINDNQYKGLKNKLNAFMVENFSGQLKLSCCRIQPLITLTAEERKIVENAVEKRCHEFSAGRSCARECLEHFGITGLSLLKGKYGEPVWPPGFTGSITHNSGVAFAVTALKNQGFIGIDFVNLSEHIAGAHLILNPEEINLRLEKNVKNPELLLFSLKESVIKILSPISQEYIEFKDITIASENSVAKITYRDKKMDIDLFWFIYSDYAFTVAVKNI